MSLSSLMEQHGTNLDIIFDDGINPNNANVYNRFVFWNGTVYDR